jgi:hypothetical protein
VTDPAAVLDRSSTDSARSPLIGNDARVRPFDFSRQQTVDRGRLRQLRPSL